MVAKEDLFGMLNVKGKRTENRQNKADGVHISFLVHNRSTLDNNRLHCSDVVTHNIPCRLLHEALFSLVTPLLSHEQHTVRSHALPLSLVV